MTSPRVTVLMPVYNRERFVDEAIASVIAQDFQHFELLIVDDGSTDGTAAILEAWTRRDARVVVVTLPENRGLPAAENAGMARARGEYVARFDSDDLMMPFRLAAQASVLDERPDVVLVSCAYETMDEAGRTIATWRADEPHQAIPFLLNFHNAVGGGGQVMFRRADVRDAGGCSLDCVVSSDYDLWVRLLRRGRILALPLVGMRQRDHHQRMSLLLAHLKRPIWSRIMTESLTHYLGRPVAAQEIEALITVWRYDGKRGVAARADRTMREAFSRFCAQHQDRALRTWVRARIARQWLEAARRLAASGHKSEALRYVLRAMAWSPSTVIRR